MEVRSLTPNDADAWFRIRRESFDAQASSRHQEIYFGDGSSYLGVDLDGALVGVTEVMPLGQYFGGRSVPTGAVVTVAVRPGARGRGVGGVLMTASLDRCRGLDLALGVLHPATTNFYRRYGWEVEADHGEFAVPTTALLALDADGSATLRDAGLEAASELRECYDRVAVQRDGWLDRSDEWWKRRALGFGEFVLILTRAERVEGYCAYDHVAAPERGDGWEVVIRELVAEDPAAARTLWRAIGTHFSQAETVRIDGSSPDDLLFDLGEQVVQPAWTNRVLGRIIDAPGAIAARGYLELVNAEVHLSLTDAALEQNNGAFVLRVEGGAGTLTPGGRGDVDVDIRTLMTLYSGFRGATELGAVGRLSGPTEALRALDAVFAGTRPGMWDDF